MAENQRKRARTHDGPEGEVEPDPVRDPDYYFDDGDFVIRAQNTLFRVHKFLLSRDSSMFQDMFALPQASGSIDAEKEGSSDAKPLVLPDTVKAFRALLWVLYSLPPVLQACIIASDEPDFDLDLLISVAEITNKYHFTSMETWSIDMIATATDNYEFGATSSNLLVRVMALAVQHNHLELHDIVVSAWDELLQSGVDPVPLIHDVERENLGSLIGATYYAQLLRMQLVRSGVSGAKTSTLTGCEGLSQSQIARLIFGHWSLTQECLALPDATPDLPLGRNCSPDVHAARCVPKWKIDWKTAAQADHFSGLKPTDLLGRLNVLMDRMYHQSLAAQCGVQRSDTMASFVAAEKKNIGSHFQLQL
ncbi:hypothetical protein C8J57DRAFT_1063134 [Mycena rebaudengoi]|nr:hypothetical protein C8J57DRAFT_1063134 [Mycena rebaudengoi]